MDNFDRIGTIARIDTVPPISGWILCSLFTSFGCGLEVSITLFPTSWCSDFFQWDTLLRRWSSSIWQQWSLEISNDSTIKNYFNSHMDHLLSGWVLNVQTILQLKATGTSDLIWIIHCQVEGNAKLNFVCSIYMYCYIHFYFQCLSIFKKKNVDIENTTLNPSQFSPLMRQGLWGSQQMPWGWVVDNHPPLSLPQAHPLPRWDCEPSHSCRRNDLEAALTCHPKNIQGKFLAMFMQNTARCFDHSYWNIQIIQSCTICNYFEIKLFEKHI